MQGLPPPQRPRKHTHAENPINIHFTSLKRHRYIDMDKSVQKNVVAMPVRGVKTYGFF
jgi:hypothetical protein